MKRSPKSMPQRMSNADDALALGRKLGEDIGYSNCRMVVMNVLEEKYMGDDRPDRDSPVAKAMLQLAGELSQAMKDHEPKKNKKA